MKHKEYLLKSFDETLINVYTIGEGNNIIIVSNGLGGDFRIFKEIIKDLPNFKFISWDYRGLYKSHMPKNKNDVSISHHINDLEAILKKEKVKKAIFLGWSIGATINIQFYKKSPQFFKSLILLNPVSKSTLRDMTPIIRILNKLDKNGKIDLTLPYIKNAHIINYDTKLLEDMISPEDYLYKLLVLVQKYHKIYSKFLKFSSKIPKIGFYFKKLKLVNSNMDDYFFEDIFKEYSKLDMELYIEIVKDLLKDNDNNDILPKIEVPVLLISATRDIFVPNANIEKMKQLIPHVEHLEVFRGSHYALIEFPEMISLGIKRFLRKI